MVYLNKYFFLTQAEFKVDLTALQLCHLEYTGCKFISAGGERDKGRCIGS